MNARPLDREHVTTEELLAVTKSTRDTLYRWVALRLLLKPRILTDPNGHYFAAWPANSLERARFILEKEREGVTMDDIVALVAGRWPATRRLTSERRGREVA